jgi:hypothetical protein
MKSVSSLLPDGEKSYSPEICANSTKKFRPPRSNPVLKTTRLGKMPTFSGKLEEIPQGFPWRHNTQETDYFLPVIHRRMQGRRGQMEKITVEKQKFSTLSTGLSTGVIHMGMQKAVFILVYISIFDGF